MRNPVKELIKNINDVSIEKNPNSVSANDLLFDVWYKDETGTFHIVKDDEGNIKNASLSLISKRVESLSTNTNMEKLAKLVLKKQEPSD